ncbi:hypothetical protein AGMMS4957_03750 [Bacteroidia bacterium]|nr:hypothetical protein AGMMS4957_03530 [Bacteroidia bacterium]GHT19454.1 hypothetical protein AGMMS4957_03750 [Bacteroidia bacterium]
MKKVVLLVRVSTLKQDYEAQSEELVAFVQKDGYTDAEMEIIEDKESATKLSDEERQGLNKMYAAIINPDNKIEGVYCWELSRLSRKPTTLWHVKGYLEERGINLIVKQQNLNLQRDKGNFDIIFSLFVGLCMQEITTKNERAERQKRHKAAQSGYNGGNIKYGYSYDPNSRIKVYIPHPEQSEIVKTLFELYATGQYGISTLYSEMQSRGYDINPRIIGQILRSREYTGAKIPEREYSEKIKGKERKITRYERTYPPIIGLELFEKCRIVAQENNNNIDKSKTIYFANHLIRCGCCGSYFVAMKANIIYRCIHRYSKITKRECTGNESININVIDSLLWNVAKRLEVDFIFNFNETEIETWQAAINDLQMKIDNSEKHYKIIVENKEKEIKKMIPNLDEKEINRLATGATQAEKQQIEQKKVHFQGEIVRFKALITESQRMYQSYMPMDIIMNEIDKKAALLKQLEKADEKACYDIVHKHIEEVSIFTMSTKTKAIHITCRNLNNNTTNIEIYYYDFRIRDKTKQIYQLVTNYIAGVNGEYIAEKDYVNFEIENRISRPIKAE